MEADSIWPYASRLLAAGVPSPPLDYSVLAVGIITLGLLLFAELLRHQLDRAAEGKPFFKTVLEHVYSELATLGVVELVIFLLVKYYEDLNISQEQTFADVHFTFFYTAVFNAFQSIFVAVATKGVSYRQWVQTEYLELDHYVEIREEFDRLQCQLYPDNHLEHNKYFSAFEYTPKGVQTFFSNIALFLKHPKQVRQYQSLLIQVRFHQLRVSFLDANHLPVTLKVSTYLKAAETKVLTKLVHISTIGWLFLTGCTCLVYFIMGMVAFGTQDADSIGTGFTYIFFGTLFGFIAVTLVLFNKMNKIFSTVINWKLEDLETKNKREHEMGIALQKSLFWMGDPHFVIALVKFMQLGYALCLAILLIYWQQLEKESPIAPYFFLITVLACYGIFVAIMGHLLPQYTLCTSMGHLVRESILQLAVAEHKLDQAQRQARRQRAMQSLGVAATATSRFGPSSSGSVVMVATGGDSSIGFDDGSSLGADNSFGSRAKPAPAASQPAVLGAKSGTTLRSRRRRVASGGPGGVVHQMRLMSASSGGEGASVPQEEDDKTKLLADLVKMDTQSLRSNLPTEERLNLQNREEVIRERRLRRKTASDGVAAMRAMAKNVSAKTIFNAKSTTPSNSAHTVTALAKSLPPTTSKDDSYVQPVQKNVKPTDSRAARIAARKSNRRKSVSASAIIQSWQADLAEGEDEVPVALEALPEQESRHFEVSLADGPSELMESTIMPLPEEKIVDFVPTIHEIDPLSSKDRKEDDGSSMDTGKSVGNLSAVDQPKVALDLMALPEPMDTTFRARIGKGLEWFSPALLRIKLRRYLAGKRYRTLSHVFGTTLIFFLIGNRIEVFITVEGILGFSTHTWQMDLNVSFWWQLAWYGIFILKSGLSLVLFRPGSSHKRLDLVMAGIFDVVLTTCCILILLMADRRRCCKGDTDAEYDGYLRWLAGEDDEIETDDGIDYPPPSECTCPALGNRTYGGLGNLEPFTSLIALRVFRFALAAKLQELFARASKKEDTSSSSEAPSEGNEETPAQMIVDGASPFHSLLYGESSRVTPMSTEKGTAVELWQHTVQKYPDIAARHGEFSAEILHAMLGLDSACMPKKDVVVSTDEKIVKVVPIAKDHSPPKMKLRGSQYHDLSVEAQGIIMAGKLGKPVMSSMNLVTMIEETNSHESGSDVAAPIGLTPVLEKTAEFIVDEQRLQEETAGHTELSALVAPTARIIRSMRRCDRKLLPLLDSWLAVDVVMTQVEIVYFEASKELDESPNEATKLALHATKGGKGLRLCDIAQGRKIVGHLDFSEITEIKVERDMPVDVMDSNDFHAGEELCSEFWLLGSKDKYVHHEHSRTHRWLQTKEDRLKIASMHGTLIFRFYSDLDDAEAHPLRVSEEKEDAGPLAMNIAFQWAQTMARTCGPEQLHQALPHFGADDSEELRDYLVVVHDHDKEAGKRGRRASVMEHLAPLPGMHHRRQSSMGQSAEDAARRSRRKSLLSLASFGNTANETGETPPAKSKSFRRASSSDVLGVRRATLRRSASTPEGSDPPSASPDGADNKESTRHSDIV